MQITQTRKQSQRTFLGALLVGGTALGAGMLALPIATAGGGIVPSWIIYALAWAFSVATGLLFVEIGLWMAPGANIVSMASRFLGKWGRMGAWVLYIFLFYCLTIAYISGGGQRVYMLLGHFIPAWMATTLFTLFFASFIYLGTKVAGKLNAILMGGLVLSYIAFISLGSSQVHLPIFEQWGWGSALLGLPVIFTSFSYQGTVPSLLEYLHRNPRSMRIAIIAGTAIPFVAYILWDFIIKGIVPVEGAHGLLAVKMSGGTAVDPLYFFLHNSAIYRIGEFFAFFALTTSFIGVSLGLMDFLADSLHISKSKKNKFGLSVLIYLPALLITFGNPSIFLTALGYAGGFGCALLLGLFPILMVWNGRYREKLSLEHQQLPGGKPLLILLGLFVIFEVLVEFYSEIIKF